MVVKLYSPFNETRAQAKKSYQGEYKSLHWELHNRTPGTMHLKLNRYLTTVGLL
jgi:hypothetical protein